MHPTESASVPQGENLLPVLCQRCPVLSRTVSAATSVNQQGFAFDNGFACGSIGASQALRRYWSVLWNWRLCMGLLGRCLYTHRCCRFSHGAARVSSLPPHQEDRQGLPQLNSSWFSLLKSDQPRTASACRLFPRRSRRPPYLQLQAGPDPPGAPHHPWIPHQVRDDIGVCG